MRGMSKVTHSWWWTLGSGHAEPTTHTTDGAQGWGLTHCLGPWGPHCVHLQKKGSRSAARGLPGAPRLAQLKPRFEPGPSQMRSSGPVDSPQGAGPNATVPEPTPKPSCFLALPEPPVLRCPRICPPASWDRQTDVGRQSRAISLPPTPSPPGLPQLPAPVVPELDPPSQQWCSGQACHCGRAAERPSPHPF